MVAITARTQRRISGKPVGVEGQSTSATVVTTLIYPFCSHIQAIMYLPNTVWLLTGNDGSLTVSEDVSLFDDAGVRTDRIGNNFDRFAARLETGHDVATRRGIELDT